MPVSSPGSAHEHRPASDPSLTAHVREAARSLGFTRVGIARAEPWPEGAAFLDWLEKGRAGTMEWLAASREKRLDVRRILPGARAVVCVALRYHTGRPLSIDPRNGDRGWISRYAWGRDYHRVMEKRLRKLSRLIKEAHPEAQCAARVDTGPILEHVAAAKAGIGWIGKNTCVIDRKEGSFFFLGEIVTDAPLIPDRPAADHCGTCTRCIDACPTDAIVEPYKLDARACIAYLTIEHKGSIPTQHREAMGTHVFGCDICQDVCPWNRAAPESSLQDFEPREGAEAPELDQLLERLLTDYDGFTRASAMRRADQRSWLRNVAVAMGNSGQDRFTPLLARLARDPDPIIREHARWAIDRLKSLRSTRILPAP